MAKEKLTTTNEAENYSPKNKRPDSIDTNQLEYTATTLLTYGTILFAVALGLGSITYMTVQQLKK